MNPKFRVLAVASLFVLLPLTAHAKRPSASSIAELKPQIADAYRYAGSMRVPVLPGTPETMARQFLRDQAGLLHLRDIALSDLVLVGVRTDKGGTNVHFEQRVAGIPVYASRIVVHISPAGMVTFVTSSYRPSATLALPKPLVTAARARDSVLARLGAAGPFRGEQNQLTAYVEGPRTRLVWLVHVSPARPIGSWEAMVDALSGDIVVLWDRALNAHATGSAFDPDPLSSSHTVYGSPMVDADDADSVDVNREIRQMDLGDVTVVDSKYYLKNQWAEVTDHETPNSGFFEQSSPDFVFTREQDGFEATNVFFHIQQNMRYVNETLGLAVHPYQYEGGVQFDPHGLDGADNSHYDGSTGQLAYGDGCVDDAEDADVVLHELGHGLHDWVTLGGLSNEVDGLSEGFGDYWAVSYSRSLHQWKPDEDQYQWVYSWDGHNECWGGRSTDYSLPWPLGLQEQHTSGQIWSTCLMRIYDRIGREKTDTATLVGLAMTNMTSNQNDAANAVYQAVQDLRYTDSEIAAVGETFGGCGYLLGVPSLPLPGGPPLSPSEHGDPAPPPVPVGGDPAQDDKRFGGALPGAALAMLMLAVLRRRRSG